MAILRSVGAPPKHIFLLLILEAGVLALLGVLFGTALAYLLLAAAQPVLVDRFGIFVRISMLRVDDLAVLVAIVVAALGIGAIPAWRAYRQSLADGLTIRV
jgi:putative ABC transport system permease protein